MSLSSLSLSVSASSKDPHHSTSSSHQSQHSQQSLAHHSTSSSSLSSQLSAVGVAVAEPLVISEESARMEHFFAFVDLSNFDVQSDAFATFKEALTKHKPVIAEYMLAHFDSFFGRYNALLSSENYVTRRQSLKLLGELLLDRANFKVMTRYIAVVDHLKRMMTLLKDKSKNIQFEAFHVFKIFVANPNKPPEIKGILYKNQQKLVQFLSEFQNEKEDEQFAEEKALLIREISALQPPEP
jgi:calcium binding protein 39